MSAHLFGKAEPLKIRKMTGAMLARIPKAVHDHVGTFVVREMSGSFAVCLLQRSSQENSIKGKTKAQLTD